MCDGARDGRATSGSPAERVATAVDLVWAAVDRLSYRERHQTNLGGQRSLKIRPGVIFGPSVLLVVP
jgi:hypothetical protein